MTCNVGDVDREIRILWGVILLSVGIFADLPAWAMWSAVVVGALALVTGTFGVCPCYGLFGINTRQPGHVKRETGDNSRMRV